MEDNYQEFVYLPGYLENSVSRIIVGLEPEGIQLFATQKYCGYNKEAFY